MEIKSIDVSSYQGKPDWAKVKKAGINFAILRIHQKNGPDTSFEHNYKGCRANKIAVGGYKYSYALTEAQALKEAEETLAVLDGRELDLPVFYDLEWEKQRKLGKEAVEKIAVVFLDHIKKAGYRVGIYCNVDWYQNVLSTKLKSYDLWLARYPANDDGTVQTRLKPEQGIGWQYSSKGKVAGISGNVDMDLFYKDYKEKAEEKKKTTGNKLEKHIKLGNYYANYGGKKPYLEKKSNAYLDDFTRNAGSKNYTKFARDVNNWGQPGCQGQPCKLSLNVKEGIIQEALVETIGCSGMTHSAAMASEILPGLTVMEALNTDLVCDAINTAMRELFLQIVYGRSQSAFSEDGLAVGAGLEDLGKGLRSQVGTMYGTLKKGPRYLEMAEGYVTGIALDEDNEIIGYQFVSLGKMTDFIKKGDDPNTAWEKAKGQYGRVADAVKIIDPRKE